MGCCHSKYEFDDIDMSELPMMKLVHLKCEKPNKDRKNNNKLTCEKSESIGKITGSEKINKFSITDNRYLIYQIYKEASNNAYNIEK